MKVRYDSSIPVCNFNKSHYNNLTEPLLNTRDVQTLHILRLFIVSNFDSIVNLTLLCCILTSDYQT